MRARSARLSVKANNDARVISKTGGALVGLAIGIPPFCASCSPMPRGAHHVPFVARFLFKNSLFLCFFASVFGLDFFFFLSLLARLWCACSCDDFLMMIRFISYCSLIARAKSALASITTPLHKKIEAN